MKLVEKQNKYWYNPILITEEEVENCVIFNFLGIKEELTEETKDWGWLYSTPTDRYLFRITKLVPKHI